MEHREPLTSASLEALLERLRPLDFSSDAVIACTEDGVIVYANAATETLLGWEPGKLLDERVSVVVPDALRTQHERGFARFVATRQSNLIGRWMSLSALRADGTQMPIHLLLTELTDNLSLLVVGRLTPAR